MRNVRFGLVTGVDSIFIQMAFISKKRAFGHSELRI